MRDLRAARESPARSRAVLVHVGEPEPVVLDVRPEAEPDELPFLQDGVVGLARGQVAEKAVLAFGPRVRGERVEQLFSRRVLVGVHAIGQEFAKEIPLARRLEHEAFLA